METMPPMQMERKNKPNLLLPQKRSRRKATPNRTRMKNKQYSEDCPYCLITYFRCSLCEHVFKPGDNVGCDTEGLHYCNDCIYDKETDSVWQN